MQSVFNVIVYLVHSGDGVGPILCHHHRLPRHRVPVAEFVGHLARYQLRVPCVGVPSKVSGGIFFLVLSTYTILNFFNIGYRYRF